MNTVSMKKTQTLLVLSQVNSQGFLLSPVLLHVCVVEHTHTRTHTHTHTHTHTQLGQEAGNGGSTASSLAHGRLLQQSLGDSIYTQTHTHTHPSCTCVVNQPRMAYKGLLLLIFSILLLAFCHKFIHWRSKGFVYHGSVQVGSGSR